MKQFKTVLKFELDTYFKSKAFILSTILICVLAGGIMFVPRIADAFKNSSSSESTVDESDYDKVAICDQTGIVDYGYLEELFEKTTFVECASADEVKSMVENQKAKNGFVVKSLTEYDVYLYNKGLTDTTSEDFIEYMQLLSKIDYCNKNNLQIEDLLMAENQQVNFNEFVLGKDSTSNYWYCYILVIIIFMLIVMYGMSIASSVTNEKSNRSIEILVTSTSPSAILFGKVFAGAIASISQAGLIGVSLLGSYQINKDYFGGIIASMLNIPGSVLVTFAIFGIGGFLFYAFLYGALGALVSKIEDLNKSAGTAQMIVMIVYIAVLVSLNDINGAVIKVLSFLPISSYSAMFARVGMGDVAMWEIVLSAVITYASVIGMGIAGGKIFRASTLRYGNPIKLSNALKSKND